MEQLEVRMCQWRPIERVVDEPGPFIYRATKTALTLQELVDAPRRDDVTGTIRPTKAGYTPPGEFRFAVAAPVLLLGVAIAHRIDSPVPAFIGAVGFVLLLYGGVVAQKSAEQAVVNLILDRITHLPLLDRLKDTHQTQSA
jgi:hypothetical protein